LPYLEQNNSIKVKENYTFTIIGNDPVHLNNIPFPANTRFELKLFFNFLTERIQEQNSYKYHVLQKNSEFDSIVGDRWTGGVHFTINKSARNPFYADAGTDKNITLGEGITVSATEIDEEAIYNWYDSDENFIYTGIDFSLVPNNTSEYILEVISVADRFKDYDTVKVVVNKNYIELISPNPSNDQIQIDYQIETGVDALIMIIHTNNLSIPTNNYNLDNNTNNLTIDLSNFSNGAYTVALVVNGNVVDAKTLIVN